MGNSLSYKGHPGLHAIAARAVGARAADREAAAVDLAEAEARADAAANEEAAAALVLPTTHRRKAVDAATVEKETE